MIAAPLSSLPAALPRAAARASALAAGLLLAQACAARPAVHPPAPVVGSCAILPPPAASPDSFAIALTSGVAATDAPVPRTPAEQLLFAQLYDTAIRASCDAQVSAGIARAWLANDAGGRVSLVLSADARFWSGDRVTARDVVAAWQATGAALPGPAGELARALAGQAVVLNDSTLTVALPHTQLLALADPSLAVYRTRAGSPWPEGSGSYRILNASGDALQLVPSAPGTRPRLSMHVARSADGRDLIDAGVDLLLTSDPATLGYAAAHPELAAVALPWDRTFVLLSPRRAPAAAPDSAGNAQAHTVRAALARDAVRVEARAADAPLWSSSGNACDSTPGTPAPLPADATTTRVVYRADDRVAGQLAERLVALSEIGAGRGAGAPLAALAPDLAAAGARAAAVGLPPAEFDAALRAGSELAYVLAVPSRPLSPCTELHRLTIAAPWLAAGATRGAAAPVPVALIETRRHAVVRRDRASIVMDWDGTLHIVPDAPRATDPIR